MAKAKGPGGRSAKPETDGKEKKGRPTFKLVGNKDKEVYPFKLPMPEGFEFGKYRALKKTDFASDDLYFEHRALEMDARAAEFRAKAEEAKKLGSTKDRAKAKKLIKLRERMEELKAQLTEQGVDVDALLEGETEE